MGWRSFVGKRKTSADGQAPAEPDVVILIHGTGAAEPDPVAPKWWETESAYAKDLRDRLGPRFDVGTSEASAPFKWNGANSESDRRSAGRRLVKRLVRLERDGRRYHLVGHSHGGSVIWHALWQSNGRLAGLRSWTSVGTPFLDFAPVWTGVTTLVALAIVAALSYAPALQLYAAAQERGVILRDGSTLGVFTTVALCLLLLLFLAGLAMAALRWIMRHVLLWRQRRRERRAAASFADRWLAIWHAEDEPIAGLSASLISPLEFVPRIAKPNANPLWRMVTWPFDHVVAPVVDQFVWVVLMRRLQGADIGGSVMVDAGSAPRPLGPGWQSMPKDLAGDMVASAGAQAPRTIENLRRRLAEMRGRGSGGEAFGQLATAVTWSEILHTSYFDIPSVRALIADRIAQSSAAPASPTSEPSGDPKRSPNVAWLTDRPRAEIPAWPEPFRPVLLNVAKIAAAGGLALLLFTGFKAAYDAYVAPHTLDGQLDILAVNATTREEMSGANVGLIGDILVRLDLLGKLGDPLIVLKRIPDPNTRGWAGQRLAYHFALNGNFAAVIPLAEDAASLELLDPADAVAFVYLHALKGAYDAQRAKEGKPPAGPPQWFLDEAAGRLFIARYAAGDVDKVRVFDPRQNLNYVWLVPALDMLAYFKHQPSIEAAGDRIRQVLDSVWLKPDQYAKSLESGQFMHCLTVGDLARRFEGSAMPPNLAAAYTSCSTPKPIRNPLDSLGGRRDPSAPSAAPEPCPTEAELDTPSPRVGELHFTWKQSLTRIQDLLKRKCNDAALAALRRHIPEPVGAYETAELGSQVQLIAGFLNLANVDGAAEIAKHNIRWSPHSVNVTTVRAGDQVINRLLCFGTCSREDLRGFADGYLAAVKLPKAPAGTAKVDFSRYRVSDKQSYFMGAALIFLELGDHAMAVQTMRDALATLPQSDAPGERYEAAFKIGRYAHPLDQALGLDAFAAASSYVYSISQTGRTAAAASTLHMRLADQYFASGEYRLARESAEKARDRLSVVAGQNPDISSDLEKIGLGDGRAVLSSYQSMLEKSIRRRRPEVAHQLILRGPKLHALALRQ